MIFRNPGSSLLKRWRSNPAPEEGICQCHNPFRSRYHRNPRYRRNPSDVKIILRGNIKTGKIDIIIDVHRPDDAMSHEHERDHRRIVEKLVGKGIISAAEVGEVTISRGESAPAPLKGAQEARPPEKKSISARRRKQKRGRRSKRAKRRSR